MQKFPSPLCHSKPAKKRRSDHLVDSHTLVAFWRLLAFDRRRIVTLMESSQMLVSASASSSQFSRHVPSMSWSISLRSITNDCNNFLMQWSVYAFGFKEVAVIAPLVLPHGLSTFTQELKCPVWSLYAGPWWSRRENELVSSNVQMELPLLSASHPTSCSALLLVLLTLSGSSMFWKDEISFWSSVHVEKRLMLGLMIVRVGQLFAVCQGL